MLAPDGAPDVPALPVVPDVEGWAEGPLVLTETDMGLLPVETDAWVPVPVDVDAPAEAPFVPADVEACTVVPPAPTVVDVLALVPLVPAEVEAWTVVPPLPAVVDA